MGLPWASLVSAGAGILGGAITGSAAGKLDKKLKGIGDELYKRSKPWDVEGAFGGVEFDQDNQVSKLGLSEDWQSQYEQQLADADAQKAYIAGMEADPMAAGQKFYEMQKALYAPEQESQRLAMENRLLGQGMLGSTGGAGQTQALLEAQRQQDLQAQYAGLDKAQSMIDTYRGRQTQGLGQAQQIGSLPMDYATLGLGLGQAMTEPASRAAELQAYGAKGMFNARKGMGRAINKGFSNLFNPTTNNSGSSSGGGSSSGRGNSSNPYSTSRIGGRYGL